MARFKQIMYLVLIIIVFIIFSEFMIRVGLKNTYKTISGEIKTASPEIVISEAKTTDVNGYVKGTIKNISEEDIAKTVIKLDLYTKRENILGDKSLEILNLKVGESREFEIYFRYNNVNNYKITCVNE